MSERVLNEFMHAERLWFTALLSLDCWFSLQWQAVAVLLSLQGESLQMLVLLSLVLSATTQEMTHMLVLLSPQLSKR